MWESGPEGQPGASGASKREALLGSTTGYPAHQWHSKALSHSHSPSNPTHGMHLPEPARRDAERGVVLVVPDQVAPRVGVTGSEDSRSAVLLDVDDVTRHQGGPFIGICHGSWQQAPQAGPVRGRGAAAGRRVATSAMQWQVCQHHPLRASSGEAVANGKRRGKCRPVAQQHSKLARLVVQGSMGTCTRVRFPPSQLSCPSFQGWLWRSKTKVGSSLARRPLAGSLQTGPNQPSPAPALTRGYEQLIVLAATSF